MIRQVEENIDLLARAIEKEARVDADQVLEQARQKAEKIRKEAKEDAEAERLEILDRAKQEAERIRGQAIATAQLKSRTMQLEHREKLLDSVFTKAYKQIPTVQQWTEYPQIVRQLLQEALQNLEAKSAIVRADQVTSEIIDKKMLKELAEAMNIQLEVGEPLTQGTGVMAESADGHLNYDNTLETRLSRMKNELRSPVYRILMGESL